MSFNPRPVDTFDSHVFAMLSGEAVRHPHSQGECPVTNHGGRTQMTLGRLIAAAQHEELVTASILPARQPSGMAGVTVWRTVAVGPRSPIG